MKKDFYVATLAEGRNHYYLVRENEVYYAGPGIAGLKQELERDNLPVLKFNTSEDARRVVLNYLLKYAHMWWTGAETVSITIYGVTKPGTPWLAAPVLRDG